MRRFSSRWLFSAGVFAFLGSALSVYAAPTLTSWTTQNGVRVYFVESHAVPLINLQVAFDAGSGRDPKEKAGLSIMTNRLLARGIRATTHPLREPALSESQISDGLARTGAVRSDTVGKDRAGVSLLTLSSLDEANRAVELVARSLAHPSFPADLLAREKKRVIAGIRESLTQPDSIAHREFSAELYGAHPYGYRETPETVASLTREDLRSFHRAFYVADTAVITIVGDADRQRAEVIAEMLSVRLPVLGRKPPPLSAVEIREGQTRFILHSSAQSHILVGVPALSRGDPDFFPLIVGNYILGEGGFVSRLMREVREKRGLAYHVFSRFEPLRQEGPFLLGLQTQKEQTGEALRVVRDVLAEWMRDGPTEEELSAAKDNLIKGFPLRIDNTRKILAQASLIGYYGLPLDYLNTWTDRVRAVTTADIRAAFLRHTPLDKLSTIVVGDVLPEKEPGSGKR